MRGCPSSFVARRGRCCSTTNTTTTAANAGRPDISRVFTDSTYFRCYQTPSQCPYPCHLHRHQDHHYPKRQRQQYNHASRSPTTYIDIGRLTSSSSSSSSLFQSTGSSTFGNLWPWSSSSSTETTHNKKVSVGEEGEGGDDDEDDNINLYFSVGMFIDLDNMSDISEFRGGGGGGDEEGSGDVPLKNVSREDVASVIRPFSRWFNSISGKDNHGETKMVAFANEHTVKYKYYNHERDSRGIGDGNDTDGRKKSRRKSEEKLERLRELEYWDSPVFDDGDLDDIDSFGFLEDTTISNAMVQTGFDENDILRCGVCGAKMKLTKKDRARGWNEYDKLNHHMKNLHDREQRKRKTRLDMMKPSKKRKMMKNPDSKLLKQMRKYEASQVGLDRHPKGKNDLFPILKEEKVHCIQCGHVDTTLIKHATKWMKSKKNTMADGKIYKKFHLTVVVSEDSDFKDLLRRARANKANNSNRIAVSVTWKSSEQTNALCDVSDIVISRRNPDEDASYDKIRGDDDFNVVVEEDCSDEGAQRKDHHNRRPSLFVATAVTERGRSFLEEYPFGSRLESSTAKQNRVK